MKSGSTGYLSITLNNLDLATVANIIFTMKTRSNTVTKEYPGAVTYDEDRFLIPLDQHETTALTGYFETEAQINHIDGSVSKSEKTQSLMKDTLATQFLDDATAVDVFSDIDLNVDQIQIVSVGGGGSVNAYTKAESDARYAKKTDLAAKANADDVYTKTEIDDKLADLPQEEPDLSDYYTKQEIDDKLDALPKEEPDLTDYYTKTETDAAIAAYWEAHKDELGDKGLTEDEVKAVIAQYLIDNPQGVTPDEIAAAVDDYLTRNPVSGVTTEDITNAVNGYLEAHPDQFKGEKGDDGYTPVKGVDYFDGEDGRTPVKGIDYFDGEKGEPGEDGQDASPEQISAGVAEYFETHPIPLGIAVSPIAPPTDGTVLFWINSSLIGGSDEPTDVEMVPNGTWQLKSSEPIKYVIIGTDDDNTGNAKFLRLCRTYGIPYTMNMASGYPDKNIQGDVDDSIFTDADAPSVFPNYVTPLADVAKYIVENDLGEVALHGFQPLWDSDEWTDELKTEIYNQYVSDGGTRSKDDFVQAVLENASATDWSQGGTITSDTKAILESDIDHQVYTLGIWGGGTSTTVDGINVSLAKVQNKGTKKNVGEILRGYNFFGAGTTLNHWGNSNNYDLNRWSAGLSHLDEGLEGIRYGQCLEFFYHYPIGDETPANLRTYFTQLKQYESEGKIKLVTRKQYVMECGEWVANPIKNISINREMTQVGRDDDDSLYTVTAYYEDGTQADVTEEAYINHSEVDTTTAGKYKIEAYYRGFSISGYAEITDSAYAIESVIINNESVSGGAIDRYTDFGDLPMTGEANATYLIEADYKINVTLGPGQRDLMAAAVWTGVNDYNNYATFYLLTREDEARTELIGHISEVVTSNRSATRNWLRFNGGSNIAIDSYEFTNIKISKLRAT